MLVLFIAPVLSPVVSATDESPSRATEARSAPDFSINSFTLSGAGSVQDGTQIHVENATHTARIVVANTGGAGSVVVSLHHQGSPTSGIVEVASMSVGPIAGSSLSNPVQFQWTASPGLSQTLYARVFSIEDPNPGNDEKSLAFDVASSPPFLSGSVFDNTIPQPAGGQTNARIGNVMTPIDVLVMNSGVKPINAEFQLEFVEASSGTIVPISSGLTILQPGSLHIPPIASTLTANVDGTSFSGLWQLTASVVFTGPDGWTDTQQISVSNIEFSEYSATLSTPADRTTEPGLSTNLTFIITNTGAQQDSFAITISSTMGWADTSQNTESTSVFGPGSTETVQVPVTVPSNAARSDIDIVTLTLTSVSTPSYTLQTSAQVMAGELYLASLDMPLSTTLVTPGKAVALNANLTNVGNVQGAFSITAGLSVAASNWSIDLSVHTTAVIEEGNTTPISINVTVPPIQQPLDISEHNKAGDVLNVWLQAIPLNGGTPTVGVSPLEVRPVIVVDPGLGQEHIQLTQQEVIDAKNGMGVDISRLMNVEVRHNLENPIANSVDATLNVGAITFQPTNSGGFSEANRWSAAVSPNTFSSLALGDVETAALGIQGPADDYPLAGIVDVPVVATPTLLGPPIAHVEIVAVSKNITIGIPTVQGADIIDKGPFDVPLGEEYPIDLLLANTGNDLTSYRLSVLDDLPDEWVVSVNTTTASSDTILGLDSDVGNHPISGNEHIADFQMKVKTDPLAEAFTLQEINVKIEDSNTGLLIDIIPVTVRVGPFIDGALSPTNQTVPINVTLMETPLTRVYVTNTGNTPTIYSIFLDTSSAGEVDFTLESPNQILIAPGFTDSVKIRMTPTEDADSDTNYTARLRVTTETGIELYANITAEVSEKRDLVISAPSQIGVLPGQEQQVDFTVSNLGNLEETFDVLVSVESGWTVEPQSQSMTLPIDEETQGSVTVSVPELGDGITLDDGSVHNLTIKLVDPATDLPAAIATVRLVISPMFILEIVEWQEEMLYHTEWERTFNATVKNVGNRDVTVDITDSVMKLGGIVESTEWAISAGTLPSQLELPVGQNISFSFRVDATETAPDLDLTAALLILHLTPTDSGIDGDAYLNSTLSMSRFFEASDIFMKPDANDGPMEVNIVYSHIPRGPSTPVAYELELCGVERLFDFNSQPSLDEASYQWTFDLVVDETTTVPLSLADVNCDGGSNGAESRIQLPIRDAWSTDNPLKFIVDAPNRPNIITDDGWDLTFRLYHPAENNGYTVFDEDTFTFQLDVFADPKVQEVWISSGTLEEGTDATISAIIRNDGTAKALIFEVGLECSGSEVLTTVNPIVELGPTEERIVTWDITSSKIDWWKQSVDGTCVVTIDAPFLSKNVEGNDRYVYKDEVYSWSPGQSSTFVAFIIFGLLSLILSRLNAQNEKYRLFAVYSGLLALGFTFHLFNVLYWGPLVLVIAALWLWRMTWMSTDEFRLIHEDYQRARKGVSTLYADHFQALADSRRQLRLILVLPVFGLLGVVLGIPPQLDTSQDNLMSLVAYVLVISIGVWYLVKRADSMYGAIYGRLTDIEVKAIRIERDLSDPARLLNELANDGIDLNAIFDEPPRDGNFMEEEVREDV